jgi:predicted ATPase
MVSDDIRSLVDLPHPFGPLIGRESELAEILNLLAAARLLTLTGTGGSGKTRLAAQVAAERQSTFPDGVRWVDLSAVADPDLVPYVVTERCGIVDRRGAPAFDALVTALRPRRVLLVLDNCEHVLSECARIIEALLAKCHDLHILAVSREAPILPGEVIWHVAPLCVPESDTVASIDDLSTFDAVALFVTRATEAVPSFRLTEENAASINRI